MRFAHTTKIKTAGLFLATGNPLGFLGLPIQTHPATVQQRSDRQMRTTQPRNKG